MINPNNNSTLGLDFVHGKYSNSTSCVGPSGGLAIAWAGPTADRCCRYCSPQDFLTFQVRNLMQLQPPEKRGYVVICGYI